MSDSVELKPCNHCKSLIVRVVGNGEKSYWISCVNCLAEGPVANSPGEAKEKWNTRTTDPLLNEMAEVMGKIEKYYDFPGEVLEEIAPEWLADVIQVMQKYREHQSLTHPNPQPPQP